MAALVFAFHPSASTDQRAEWTSFGTSSGLPSASVYSIAASRGEVWAGTDGAVARFIASNSSWVAMKPPGLDTRVTCISICKGSVWFGTFGSGLFRYKAGSWKSYKSGDGLPDDRVEDLASNGNYLFIATSGGASRASANAESPSFETIGAGAIPEQATSAVAITKGMVWFGTKANGVIGLDRDSFAFRKKIGISEGLPDSRILSLAADKEFLWIGTGAGGLCRYDAQDGSLVVYNKAAGVADNLIASIALNSKTWCASWTAGVTSLDRQGIVRVYRDVEEFAANDVRDVAVDDGFVWFATAKGVVRFSGESAKGEGVPLLYVAVAIVLIASVSSWVVVRTRKHGEPSKPTAEKKRPYEICAGKPDESLCPFCKYNVMKGGRHHCSRYRIPIPFER